MAIRPFPVKNFPILGSTLSDAQRFEIVSAVMGAKGPKKTMASKVAGYQSTRKTAARKRTSRKK